MNHAARRASHPSEYQPVARIPKRIIADPDRKAYWCHLCYCSRLKSTGMDLHYEQAHPTTQARDASSRLHTTYSESRHGRPGEWQNVERHSLTQVASAVQEHSKKRKRPAVQLRPDRSRYAPPCSVDEIPLLLQPPTLPRPLSGYPTVNNAAFATPRRAGMETPSLAPDSPSHKRRRLSNSDSQHAKRAAKDWGGYFDDSGSEDGDVDGDVPHDASSAGIWNGTGRGMRHANSNKISSELSASETEALDAGAAYKGEGQGRPVFHAGIDVDLEVDVDAAAPSETATDGKISAMEMLVRRMFLKQAELRGLMVEAMELVRAEVGAVA